jgi:hypothetical protein
MNMCLNSEILYRLFQNVNLIKKTKQKNSKEDKEIDKGAINVKIFLNKKSTLYNKIRFLS